MKPKNIKKVGKPQLPIDIFLTRKPGTSQIKAERLSNNTAPLPPLILTEVDTDTENLQNSSKSTPGPSNVATAATTLPNSTTTDDSNDAATEETSRKRKAPTNIRRQNTEKMTKLFKTEIQYSDDIIIGEGATAKVYKGSFASIPAAIKRVNSKYINFIQDELKTWLHMKEKVQDSESLHVLTLYGWKEWEEGRGLYYYFAMELGKCDLNARIEEINERHDSERNWENEKLQLVGFIHDACKGLSWIHKQRIVHRDIKPENVIIVGNGDGTEIAKLGDFGISRKITGMGSGTNSVGKGTAYWMSPEALRAVQRKSTFKTKQSVDIFSMGMTAHFTLSLGVHPFADSELHGTFINDNITDETIEAETLGPPEYAADHLFQWMMNKQENPRPKILHVLQHPLFWTEKKCMDFIVDVAKSFNSKNEHNAEELKRKIDESYKNMQNADWDWTTVINKRLFDLLNQRQSQGKKRYDGKSIMKLIELIRDKNLHYKDMVSDLLTDDFFGDENGHFSESKYANYFVKTFPDLVVFLFSEFANRKRNCIGTLRSNYFMNLNNTKVPLLSG